MPIKALFLKFIVDLRGPSKRYYNQLNNYRIEKKDLPCHYLLFFML